VLVCLDGFMNIALEQSEEWVDGTLTAKYGDCFLRGNNGACVVRAHPIYHTPTTPPPRDEGCGWRTNPSW
jgi:hypothetical protein